MKTPITLEKEDILKLVYVFLKKRGFDIPSPDKVTYKGALQVTINIEHALELSEVEEAFAPKKALKVATETPPSAPTDEDGEPSMESILESSQRTARENPPKVNHTLGPDESVEYPR